MQNNKVEAAPPTFYIDSLMFTLELEAKEERDADTGGIKGACLHAE